MPLDADDLRQLQADLRSEDPVVRAAAVGRASEAIDATVMSVVAQALLSENPEVRAKAVALIDRLAELAEE
jgi:flagellar capping protein FliD